MKLTRIGAHAKRISLRRIMSGQKGQTLVEMLVAVTILGIGGVALLGGLSWSYHVAILNDQRTMAESLTRSELERIRYATYPIADSTTAKLGDRYQVVVDAEYVIPQINDTVEPYTTSYEISGSPQTMQLVTVTILNDVGRTLLVTTTNKVSR